MWSSWHAQCMSRCCDRTGRSIDTSICHPQTPFGSSAPGAKIPHCLFCFGHRSVRTPCCSKSCPAPTPGAFDNISAEQVRRHRHAVKSGHVAIRRTRLPAKIDFAFALHGCEIGKDWPPRPTGKPNQYQPIDSPARSMLAFAGTRYCTSDVPRAMQDTPDVDMITVGDVKDKPVEPSHPHGPEPGQVQLVRPPR